MKKYTLIVLLCVIAIFAFSEGSHIKTHRKYLPEVYSINLFDTVYFDLSRSTISGGYIQIPVFFRSDDVINALDFALKFDLNKLQYDSVIIYRPTISPLVNYNSGDSTLRLTSFDLQPIPNDTLLVALRFKLLNGTTEIHRPDFNSIVPLLNGDPCTGFVIEPGIPSGINGIAQEQKIMQIYPNPASSSFTISVRENTSVQLVNTIGQIVFHSFIPSGEKQIFDIENLPAGIYLLQDLSNSKVKPVKLTVK